MVKKATSQQKKSGEKTASQTPKLSRKIKKKGSPSSESKILPIDTTELLCITHPDQHYEFLCVNPTCLAELCSHCILTHRDHIDEIKPIAEVLQISLDSIDVKNLENLQNKMKENRDRELAELEAFVGKIKNQILSFINYKKNKMITEDEKVSQYFHSFGQIRSSFEDQQHNKAELDSRSLTSLKSLLKFRRKRTFNSLVIEHDLIEKQFSQLLTDSISLNVQGCQINSTSKDVPKYLHWFEWEKRDLHLFDVVNYCHKVVRLTVYFKIPPFSRSIIIPDGRIFLAGGEDPETGAKKDVYYVNVKNSAETVLHARAPMPSKKYDFSMCYHNGFIYVICGKGQNSDILDTCEKYDVEKNTWACLSRVNKKRYAASAVVASEIDKIYLFGGRSDHQNLMAEQIEEYSIATDVWTLLNLKNPQDFIPVEVCAAVQIAVGKIMIFGGSDSSIHDTRKTYVFNYEENQITEVGSLKKAHVFVSLPFVYGSHVFAVGNEYYVKNRNVHRFSMETLEWDLIY